MPKPAGQGRYVAALTAVLYVLWLGALGVLFGIDEDTRRPGTPVARAAAAYWAAFHFPTRPLVHLVERLCDDRVDALSEPLDNRCESPAVATVVAVFVGPVFFLGPMLNAWAYAWVLVAVWAVAWGWLRARPEGRAV